MTVTYKKLWHILIDRNMKKKDLQEQAGITKYALNKLSRNEDVTTETLGRICAASGSSIPLDGLTNHRPSSYEYSGSSRFHAATPFSCFFSHRAMSML